MLTTLAVANYRSLRDLVLPLQPLNLITGPNGSGKSGLYRSLRLLAETAAGTATAALAREGGLDSVLWAGPEESLAARGAGERAPRRGPRRGPVALRLGFAADELSYAIDFGLPSDPPPTLFVKDPQIKREVIWHGPLWHDRRALVDRRGALIRARDDSGTWCELDRHAPAFDSLFTRVADPARAPEVFVLREQIRSWRFYDHFRTDRDAPARQPQVGTHTPALSNDGHDLAAAWETIREIGDADGLQAAVADAFPGAAVTVVEAGGRFELRFHQQGLLRPLSQAELSDGTLRYLLWIAALMTARPPGLMVLNEPETSLHPELLAALGRLMGRCARQTQLWVISHSRDLIASLLATGACHHLQLEKELGETRRCGESLANRPAWKWPVR